METRLAYATGTEINESGCGDEWRELMMDLDIRATSIRYLVNNVLLLLSQTDLIESPLFLINSWVHLWPDVEVGRRRRGQHGSMPFLVRDVRKLHEQVEFLSQILNVSAKNEWSGFWVVTTSLTSVNKPKSGMGLAWKTWLGSKTADLSCLHIVRDQSVHHNPEFRTASTNQLN